MYAEVIDKSGHFRGSAQSSSKSHSIKHTRYFRTYRLPESHALRSIRDYRGNISSSYGTNVIIRVMVPSSVSSSVSTTSLYSHLRTEWERQTLGLKTRSGFLFFACTNESSRRLDSGIIICLKHNNRKRREYSFLSWFPKQILVRHSFREGCRDRSAISKSMCLACAAPHSHSAVRCDPSSHRCGVIFGIYARV